MAKLDYPNFPDLEFVYLEDSYVTAIKENYNTISFDLMAVLLENHPFYTIPLPNEQYCYKEMVLGFNDISNVRWIKKSLRPIRDATGHVDFGNIDFLWRDLDKHVFHLGGDWGELEMASDFPVVKFM